MKVRLLPLAISAAIAMPGVALAEGPTVYGKLNVSYEMVDVDNGLNVPNSDADRWEVISNASRIGVKGDAAISDALKATYLIEWEVSGEGDATDLGQRNRSVGLAGRFGAFDIGKYDSPLKVSQGKVDQFNDLSGDLKFVLLGDERPEDIMQYSSPVFGGIQVKVAVMPGEQFADNVDATEEKDGPAEAYSTSVTFTQDMLYLALAYDAEMASSIYTGIDAPIVTTEADNPLTTGFGGYYDTVRLTGQITLDAFQLGAMYQMAESSDPIATDDVEQDGFLVSGAFTLGNLVLKAQYSLSTTEATPIVLAASEFDAEDVAVGVDYKLSKQTTVFGYYNMLSFDGDTDKNPVTDDIEETKDNLGVGIVHNF